MKQKRLPTLKQPKLRLLQTVGGFYRVEIHGEDDLRDPPRNYAVMNIGMAWTAVEALAQAQAWFAGLIDDTSASRPLPEAAKEP